MAKDLVQTILIMVLSGLTVLGLGGATAIASELEYSSTDEWLKGQEPSRLRQSEAAERFVTWLEVDTDVALKGYLVSALTEDGKAVVVRWKDIPEPTKLAVSEAAHRFGVEVRFENAPFSLDEYLRVTDRALSFSKSSRSSGIIYGGATGIGRDTKSIEILYSYVGDRGERASALAQFADAVKGTDTVPVTLSEGDLTIGGSSNLSSGPVATSPVPTRSNDTAPFAAGGYMRSTTSTSVCSTGFAIAVGGIRYATTARHCAQNYVARDGSATYGTGTRAMSNIGAARVLNATGRGYMFDGRWDNSVGYNKRVSGLWDVKVGDHVCTSGGNSGVHCGLEVTNLWVMINDGYGDQVPTIKAETDTLGVAVVAGDSGGPVLVPLTDGTVGAVGMIQAHTSPASGYVWDARDPNNHGKYDVLFTSTRTIVSSIPGATLVTN
ncbi:MAG: hypothetical protein SPI77_08705 [Corynebacterium sp.]|nr:hypothetical protein [Corynebacterium sp.]